MSDNFIIKTGFASFNLFFYKYRFDCMPGPFRPLKTALMDLNGSASGISRMNWQAVS